MSIENVRSYFRSLGREGDIREFSQSSATVELAAQALGVSRPDRQDPPPFRTGRAVC